MPSPHTTPPIPLNIPILGLNKRDALDEMAPTFSPWLVNWEPQAQFLKVRKGYVVHCNVGFGDRAVSIMNYKNTELFAYMWQFIGDDRIYDVTTSTASLEQTATGDSDSDTMDNTFDFAGISAFTGDFDTANMGYEYNGSSWSTFGFTDNATAGLSYKGRVYMGNNGTIEYGGLEAITGATTSWSVTELFEQDDEIAFIRQITSPTNTANEQYFVFGNLDGEILVYAGDFPDAANWEQIAKFRVPRLLGYKATLEVNNDIYIATINGIVSLRKLFSANGDILEQILISGQLTEYWTDLVRNITETEGDVASAEVSLAYWEEQNKVYVLINGFLDIDGTYTAKGSAATFFVYNVTSQGWTIQKTDAVDSTYGAQELKYFNNGIYYTAGPVIMTQSPTVYKDEDPENPGTYTSYAVELHSAYQNLASTKKFKKVEGFDLVVKTDFDSDSVGMKAAADFGRKVSAESNVTLTDGYNNPFYSVGVDGNYLQWRITGNSDTTSTDGYELYSVGVSVR